MKKIESLSVRTVVMMCSTFLIHAISFITAPIFTRILTTEDFGIFSLYLSWVSMLTIIMGVQTYGSLNHGKRDFKPNEYEIFCSNVYLLSLIVGLLCGIFLYRFYPFFEGIIELPSNIIIYMIFSVYGMYSVTFLNKYFLLKNKVIENLIIALIVAISTTMVAIILIVNTDLEGYYARALAHGGIYLIMALGISVYFLKKGSVRIKLSYWKYCLHLSLPLVAQGLSGRILSQSDRIMLNEYKGETIVGIYSFCYTLALPVSILVETLNTSWVPEFYALMKEGKTEEIHLHFGRQLFLVTAICCGYLLVVPEGLKLLAPVEYWKGMNILPLVIVGFFFSFIYFYPVNYELYHKKVKYSALCTTLAALLNIILNYLLIPKFEMVGASVATLIAFIFRFIFHDLIARYIVKDYDVNISFYLKGLIPIMVVCYLTIVLLDWVMIRWTIATIIGIMMLFRFSKQRVLI